jgi:hypothetical protein
MRKLYLLNMDKPADLDSWSNITVQQIKLLKKAILKKKIMLGFVIDSYSKYDKIFRYLHILLAVCVFGLGVAEEIARDSTGSTSTVTIILSAAVVAMMKLKDYLNYDKIKESAKQQTIKYEQLYQRIEREMFKPNGKRQKEEDFLYWIGREYNGIEMADPELSHSMQKKFAELCKEKGIPYDSDLEALTVLLRDDEDPDQNMRLQIKIVEEVNKEDGLTKEMQKADRKILESNQHGANPFATTESATDIKPEQADIVTELPEKEPTKDSISPKETTTQLVHTRQPTIRLVPRQSLVRTRSGTEEEDRVTYKEKMKTFDSKADLQWAMERLQGLDTT